MYIHAHIYVSSLLLLDSKADFVVSHLIQLNFNNIVIIKRKPLGKSEIIYWYGQYYWNILELL